MSIKLKKDSLYVRDTDGVLKPIGMLFENANIQEITEYKNQVIAEIEAKKNEVLAVIEES